MKMKKKSLLIALPILASASAAVAIATPIVLNHISHADSVLLNNDSTVSSSSMNFEDAVSPELKNKILELERQANKNSHIDTLEQIDTLTGQKPSGNVKEITNSSMKFEDGVSPELKAVILKLERQSNSNSHVDSLSQFDTLTGQKPSGDVKEISDSSMKFENGVSPELKTKILELEHQIQHNSESGSLEQYDILTGRKPQSDVKEISNSSIQFADNVSPELKEKILKLENQSENRSNSNPLEQIDTITGLKPTGGVKKINNEFSSFAFFSNFNI